MDRPGRFFLGKPGSLFLRLVIRISGFGRRRPGRFYVYGFFARLGRLDLYGRSACVRDYSRFGRLAMVRKGLVGFGRRRFAWLF